MTDLSNMMRQRRFKIVAETSVALAIESPTCQLIELKVSDCSLSGLGCTVASSPDLDDLRVDQIIPAAKLSAGGKEHTLGRLVVRRLHSTQDGVQIGFSTIDAKVPIDGFLHKFVEVDLDSAHQTAYAFELSPDKFNLGSFATGSAESSDIFARAVQFDVFYQEWRKSPKFQYHNIRLPSKGNRVTLKQKRRSGRDDYLVMCSNDYLGLAAHPEVIEASKKAIDQYGFGSTGSPLTTGLTDLHESLCNELAKTFRREKVLLFNSGYAANVGTIAGLTREHDFVLSDMICHASLQDAMSMSKAACRFYKHNDIGHLEKMLAEHRSSHAGCLVVTEGVFSMDGDVAPLEEISRVARKHNARVFLDEAHSFGVIGPTGLGCWEKHPNAEVDIIMGTFSKICGGIGGFIATTNAVANWLSFYGRSHMFSVTIPPSTAAAALAALNVFQKTPSLLTQLRQNITHFVSGLRDLGCPIDRNHESSVIPVIIGNEQKLGIMNEVFREHGVYVIPIVYPAVGRSNSRFRFTMMATHTISDIDYVLNIIEMAMMKAHFKFDDQNSRNPKPISLVNAA